MDASDLPPPSAAASPPPASLFDALPDALLRFDTAMRVVYVNAAFERATLLAGRALIGHRLDEVEGFAAYADLWQHLLREVLESEEERWFKFGFEHPFGRRHFDVRLLLERGPESRHVTALLRDVTYTRGAVRASRGADAFADAMLSAVNVGIALLDRDLRLRHFNAYLERLWGLDAGQVLGLRPDQIFDLSALPEVMASYQSMKSGATRGTEQHDYLLPTAAPTLVRERRTPIFDARGAFDGVLVLVERLQPARFAETSLSALRGALEHAGELVLEIGSDGTVLDANDTAVQALGLTRAEFGAVSLLQIDSELTAGEFTRWVERLRQHGAERRETRYASRRRSGELQVEVIAQRAERDGRETIFLLARDIGERKRAELALLESAERFRSLFDENPVALLLLDENLRVLQANRAASRLLDRALIDLVGAEAAALLAGGDAAAAQRLRRDLAAETLTASTGDVRIVHADGQAVWARLVVRGWRAERSRRYLLVLEDTTERKQAALQLEAAVVRQRTLLETMAAAVAQVRNGVIVQANAEFARLFGLAEPAVVGMPLARLTEGGGAGEPSPGPLPPVEAGRTTNSETLLLRADGRPLWCFVQVRAVPAAAAGPATATEVIYTFQEITEQRESREALARSLLELNLVFDSTEVALLHLADGRVIRCNAQAVVMFGGADGPIGRPFAALVEWSADDPLPTWLSARGFDRGAAPAEARMRGADNVTFWALVSMRAIDPQYPGAGQIVTVLSIDERKRSEQEILRMRQYLDLVVESLPVSIAVRGANDGRFISINRAGEALLGRQRDAVIGRTWHQIHPPALADELAALDSKALEGRQMIDQPRAVSRSVDGRSLTVHRRVLPIFEADGIGQPARPRYLMSIVDDLSDTVRTEAALQDTEAHFRELAEHIDAFVFIADRNLATLTYASPRCEALLGLTVHQLQADARLALERVQAHERPLLARRLPFVLARLARLRRAELTVRIDHPKRGARSIAVRLTPVRMPKGQLRIFGVAEDVTDREAVQDQRLAAAIKSHDVVMHELRQRLRKNLHGIAGLLQQQAFARPEIAETLAEAVSQIQAIGLVHGMTPTGDGGLPFVALVQGIFSSLAAVYNSIVQVEPPGYVLSRWLLTETEAIPMALVVNELGGAAIRLRGKTDQRVVARMSARGERIELRIEQPGRLVEGFDLARVPASVSGLGLAKALLPHRGARLRVEQLGPLVITRLQLMPPAVHIAHPPPADS